jgi:hypothetical protein
MNLFQATRRRLSKLIVTYLTQFRLVWGYRYDAVEKDRDDWSKFAADKAEESDLLYKHTKFLDSAIRDYQQSLRDRDVKILELEEAVKEEEKLKRHAITALRYQHPALQNIKSSIHLIAPQWRCEFAIQHQAHFVVADVPHFAASFHISPHDLHGLAKENLYPFLMARCHEIGRSLGDFVATEVEKQVPRLIKEIVK